MNIKIDELLENSFVISINKTRYAAFLQAFSAAGFTIFPKLVNGFIVNSNGGTNYKLPKLTYPILGNSFTHASIVKYGQTFNKDFVCIFEDDAFPCIEVQEKLTYYLEDIPDDAGILKLGISILVNSNGYQIVNSKYIKNLYTFGCHAYVVFKKYYDMYFKLFEKNIVCDHDVFNASNDIYMTKENLFIQRNVELQIHAINKNRNCNIVEYHAKELQLDKINVQM